MAFLYPLHKDCLLCCFSHNYTVCLLSFTAKVCGCAHKRNALTGPCLNNRVKLTLFFLGNGYCTRRGAGQADHWQTGELQAARQTGRGRGLHPDPPGSSPGPDFHLPAAAPAHHDALAAVHPPASPDPDPGSHRSGLAGTCPNASSPRSAWHEPQPPSPPPPGPPASRLPDRERGHEHRGGCPGPKHYGFCVTRYRRGNVGEQRAGFVQLWSC